MLQFMKNLQSVVVIALIAILFSSATPRFALAIAGGLSSPAEIAHNDKYPANAQKKLVAALQRKDCKFVGGSWVNFTSALHYEGDARALSLFIGDLVHCPGITVTVTFKTLGTEDWIAVHDSHENSLQIQINLKSKRVDLKKLTLPPIKGPELESTEDEIE